MTKTATKMVAGNGIDISISGGRGKRGAGKREQVLNELKGRGISIETVPLEDGSAPTVMVRGASLRRLGLSAQQVSAAERFSRDYETANHRGLRCRGFEPGVDQASRHAVHLAQESARMRLTKVKQYVGERSYQIVLGIVLGASVNKITSALDGRHILDKRVVSNEINNAFSQLVEFYDGHRAKDPTWAAFERFVQEFESRAEKLADGRDIGRESLEDAERRFANTKGATGRKRGAPPAPVTKEVADIEPASAAGLAGRAARAISDWAKLEKLTVSAFSVSAAGDAMEITGYAVDADGRQRQYGVQISSKRHLAEAMDAQLIKAGEAHGWKERVLQP